VSVPPTITRRELNRATLARQLLLDRFGRLEGADRRALDDEAQALAAFLA